MKVSELKKGMMLACTDNNDCFAIYGNTDKWVMVRPKPKKQSWYNHHLPPSAKICKDPVMIYLGTKQDIDIDMKWTDRFVLIDSQIVGVDPAAWRRIKPSC
tara:strand:+ start:1014 stop:1316 length:303 start_codon:yes stop_codon:yes gene_type:complete